MRTIIELRAEINGALRITFKTLFIVWNKERSEREEVVRRARESRDPKLSQPVLAKWTRRLINVPVLQARQ